MKPDILCMGLLVGNPFGWLDSLWLLFRSQRICMSSWPAILCHHLPRGTRGDTELPGKAPGQKVQSVQVLTDCLLELAGVQRNTCCGLAHWSFLMLLVHRRVESSVRGDALDVKKQAGGRVSRPAKL